MGLGCPPEIRICSDLLALRCLSLRWVPPHPLPAQHPSKVEQKQSRSSLLPARSREKKDDHAGQMPQRRGRLSRQCWMKLSRRRCAACPGYDAPATHSSTHAGIQHPLETLQPKTRPQDPQEPAATPHTVTLCGLHARCCMASVLSEFTQGPEKMSMQGRASVLDRPL